MTMRSPLGRVRGLGASGTGARLFWLQRLSAMALIGLCLWFVASAVSLAGADWSAFQAWISTPWTMALLSATLILAFLHAQIGLQVILEDYVANEAARTAAIVAVKIAAFLLCLFSLAAVLKTAFMGG